MNTKEKIGRYIFLSTLGLEAVAGFGIGLLALLNFPLALKTGFGIPHTENLDVLGIIIGLALIFIGSMCLLSIKWTLQGDGKGVILGIGTGIYIFSFGFLAFALLGDVQALLIDSIRGALTIIFGISLYKQLLKAE
ncbi:MAG: hypothetical protein ACI9H6_000552 [Patiriisocius sp.]|jgi:hypothetical protein